jgi:hypothetical protein
MKTRQTSATFKAADGSLEWWTFGLTTFDGSVEMFVEFNGIRQDITPDHVAAAAVIIWSNWLNEA